LAAFDTVVKIGGGLLSHAERFDALLATLSAVARTHRLLVVPGGGPFADLVRDVDRRFHLSDDAAHWMAVLAMDQYAHLIASRLENGVLVSAPGEIAAVGPGHVPVLAPSRWRREADPLPHAWTVTSDSIAAWVAGAIGARRLILVKPPGAAGGDLVDPYFARTLPAHVMPAIVTADQPEALYSALRGEIDRH
jgi:aspartokinase-like uncharacterized kinase